MYSSVLKSLVVVICATVPFVACGQDQQTSEMDQSMMEKAESLAQSSIIIDTHVDVPYRLNEHWEDISNATETGDFDYPRARKGGLNAPFMSVYIPAELQLTGGAPAFADEMIDMVEGFVASAPDKFAIATSPNDVREQFEAGLISLPMGMENGAPIESLDLLAHFAERGIRYVTLTHGKVNLISDSSYDPERKWNGLSPYGEEVVKEMNRLGIMVDISHVSDSAFYDVMAVTQAPAIASHSSARHFTPGFERNMSDAMIQALAAAGGVIQINFGSSFITHEANLAGSKTRAEIANHLEREGIDPESEEGKAFEEQYHKDHPAPFADVTDVVDHIDHVVQLTSINNVGIGSDYDGVGDSLPTGLKDVSSYPNLIFHLLKRGYSEEDVKKILGENLLRVWSDVEDIASQLQEEN